MTRLVVAARPYDLSDAPYDGFVERRHLTLRALREDFDVRIILLRPHHDETSVLAELEDLVCADLPLSVRSNGRTARVRHAVQMGRDADQLAPGLGDAVRRAHADAAVTWGPWLDDEYDPVFAALPTVHFFEEDLTQMHEIASQSRRARALRWAERAPRRLRAAQPRAVVHISPKERRNAEAMWPAARAFWHPYLLDPRKFPLAGEPSTGNDIVVIGQFAEERNAEGLAMVLAAMPAEHPARLTLVSGAGVHPCLGPFVDRGALRLRSGNGDAYPLYRSARATLVPARRVTGVKTTLLQAWAAGCPSVCFTASARSIGPFARGATIAVGGAADAAEALRRLHEDEALRRQLVSSATDVLREHFDPAARTTALHDLIRAVSADRAW